MDSKYVEVTYGAVTPPETSVGLVPVDLTADTWNERLQKIRSRMKAGAMDALAVYGDREHGGNFAYLTGFEPRFEEAVLVLRQDGQAALMVGNENRKMCAHSALRAGLVHVAYFSLYYGWD